MHHPDVSGGFGVFVHDLIVARPGLYMHLVEGDRSFITMREDLDWHPKPTTVQQGNPKRSRKARHGSLIAAWRIPPELA